MYHPKRISLMFRSVKTIFYHVIVLTLLVTTPVGAVDTLPILWEAGGQSSGNDSAGQAARIVTDASGNVAVVSGPSLARDLAVTSYTSTGAFRWQNAVSPSSGTFAGDWVAAAPNGDFVAVGHNVNSSGQPIAITLVRFGSDGTFQWRVDLNGLFPSVGRLLVDSGGNAYLAFNALGDGQDIQLHKYSPAGALLWSKVINTGSASNNIATSLAFSPDQTEVAVTGDTSGGSEWITALYNTSTGLQKWLVVAGEGTAALDVVIDAARVYVTGLGKVNITGYLTVVAYDRATGARLWRTDKKPVDGGNAAGLRMTMAPDGSLVATGQTSRGFLDWYTVAFETTGAVRWEAVRDGGLNTDEIPAAVLVLPDGTTVVTGKGGPNLQGGFIPGVTVGYSPAGTLLWEAFSPLVTVWVTDLPNGDVVATGGYDAYLAAFRPFPVNSVCGGSGTLIEGFGETGDFNATCGSDDSYWAAHGASLFFQIADPVVQFELTATVPAGFGGSTISVDVEASKQNANGNLNLRALLFNFTTGSYVSLPGIMPLATSDAVQNFALPVGSNPGDFIEPGTNEVWLLLQTIQTSGLPNVRTQLDEVLFNFQ